jgi:hypothetical protein
MGCVPNFQLASERLPRNSRLYGPYYYSAYIVVLGQQAGHNIVSMDEIGHRVV